MAGAMVEIYCFGDFRVCFPERKEEMKWRTKKARELFAYLVHKQKQAVERDELIRKLWPEMYPDNAVALFHNLVYSIRKEMAAHEQQDILRHGEGGYTLNWRKIRTDLEEFQLMEAMIEQYEADAVRHKAATLERYQGMYMGSIDGIWMYSQREYYEQIILKGYRMIAKAEMERHAYSEAIRYLQKALEIDPFSDQTMVLLLRSFGAIGDLKRMKVYYERFRDILKKEFSIEPGMKVVAAFREGARLQMERY